MHSSPAPPFLELIGHRGAPRAFVENTMPSFREALARGAHAIELDVHASRDGVVVVHHDPIPRAWRGPGDPEFRPIASLTWAELQSLDAGDGARMPALADVLELAARRAVVYVEIKGTGIEQRVVEVIARSSATCAVHSFDHAAIARVRELAPALPRGLLFEERHEIESLVHAYRARDLWPAHRLIDGELIARARDAGARVIAWTVNAPARAATLAALGVAGLCTDDLAAVRGAVAASRE